MSTAGLFPIPSPVPEPGHFHQPLEYFLLSPHSLLVVIPSFQCLLLACFIPLNIDTLPLDRAAPKIIPQGKVHIIHGNQMYGPMRVLFRLDWARRLSRICSDQLSQKPTMALHGSHARPLNFATIRLFFTYVTSRMIISNNQLCN